jgi:hypothetical protein
MKLFSLQTQIHLTRFFHHSSLHCDQINNEVGIKLVLNIALLMCDKRY